ncbi:MAG: beta-galactosidase trimerization domain-containing protein, partial [Clostridia bacterium]|nr:beta-galactosidase trimerization domain-containing protein [Clostridia bacterium]
LPVTINMMFEFYDLNYHRLAEVMDIASWDSYPEWGSTDDAVIAQKTAFWHDLYRSLKDRPFLLMESTPSLVNWKSYNKLKAPGLDVLSSLQAVAHGSDSVQYFQWRKSRGSSEKFHGAVVGHDGTADTRVFRSVQKTGQILKDIDGVCGSVTPARAAVIFDWENWWALDDAQGFAKDDKKYLDTCYSYHREFWKRGIDCDVVSPLSDLSRYSIVAAPMLYLVDEARAENLRTYVEGGGTLYATYMLSTVDGSDLCHLGGIPGLGLKEVFGLEAEEIDTLYPHERCSAALEGEDHELADYCEVVKLKGAAPLAVYSAGWYAGEAAVAEHPFGKGKAVYQACRDTGSLKDSVFEKLLEELELHGPLEGEIPHGVTAQTRTDGEHTFVFLQNYSLAPSGKVTLRQEMQDLITGETVRELALEPYAFRVLKR